MSHPVLYQIHARDWLQRSGSGAQPQNLNRIPDEELDRLAASGFDWLYLLGVWQTGQAGAAISRNEKSWLPSFEAALPDLKEADIIGSTFAITSYTVHADFGGNAALATLRNRLRERGIRLLLDFVGNHTALDHPWVVEHPEYFITGTEADLTATPQNFVELPDGRILAHGRDPYFPGWPDTLQLNYGNESLQLAMLDELRTIASMCDGVRCDMAMLLLSEIFYKTWRISTQEFWPTAIAAARGVKDDFLFVAEVYWGLEWTLRQQGFDYCYDKTLYDRLLDRAAAPVRAHLSADIRFQEGFVRFLENHDEPRVAASLPPPTHKAAAVVAYFVPGMSFFHQGELRGYVRKPSIHLARRAVEADNVELREFYERLLDALKVAPRGAWILLTTYPAWDSNPTAEDFICFAWRQNGKIAYLIAVNYADHASQCYIRFPHGSLREEALLLQDVMGPEVYERSGRDMVNQGLYVAMPPWAYHVFRLTASG